MLTYITCQRILHVNVYFLHRVYAYVYSFLRCLGGVINSSNVAMAKQVFYKCLYNLVLVKSSLEICIILDIRS